LIALGLDQLRDRQGAAVAIGELQPDLIQFFPPLAQHLQDDPTLSSAYREEVLPNGDTNGIDPTTDSRIRLRVVDVKLSSEPGSNYFAETVFYSMTLAAWLRENHLDDRFLVAAVPAVLPGSLDDSFLKQAMAKAVATGTQLTSSQTAIAWEEDLERAPVEAFAPRIRQLTREILPRVLATPWTQVEFHVDYRCAGCEFLGDPHIMSHGQQTQDPLHCWPEAERTEHLSRVFGLTRGATLALRSGQVGTTTVLAAIPAGTPHAALAVHHGLKSRRTIFPARALSLQQQASGVIPNSGGDALMPRWPNLHVYVFLDYDPATSFTIALGCRAFWKEPLPFGSALQAATHKWGRAQGDTEIFLVDEPTVVAERREFTRFLRHLRGIFDWVAAQDVTDEAAGRRDAKTRNSNYQIYLWDDAQRRHFVRLVSRHLGSILNDPHLRQLAWIFPPPELLANPETASRRTPYTLAYDVVQNTIAVPSPHHYTLLDVARGLVTPPITAPSTHPLYRDTLSNLMPPERIHEFWTRRPNWQQTQALLVETTGKKLAALGMVVSELERRLGPALQRLSAPPLPTVPRRPRGLAPEGYLWLEFARLNSAVESLDVDRIRAMPTHERESRFRSARLLRRLNGAEAIAAWNAISRTTGTIPPVGNLMLYELSPDSRDFNARPGDFNFALAPGDRPGFLDEHPYSITRGTPVQASWGATTVDAASLTGVSVAGIDRIGGTIALLPDRRSKFADLAQHIPQLDFDQNVMLDPVHRDYLSSKVELTLRGIGFPACAAVTPSVAMALGLPTNAPAGTDPVGPAGEVLWLADQLHVRATGRNVATLRASLDATFQATDRVLMPDQWSAWEHALGQQLTLIWGPPGTGKSHTLRAIVMGAVAHARQAQQSLRVLVSANTYTAVDNIILKLQDDLRSLVGGAVGSLKPYALVRVQSDKHRVDHDFVHQYADVQNIPLNRAATVPPAAAALLDSLEHPDGIVIVGAPSQQMHNLAVAGINRPPAAQTQREWFDLIIVDEASQMDVASSTLVISKRAANGACVFAGDDLQLPPIHPAEAPEDLEHEVGSIYNFLRHIRNVPYNALNISFRSNSTLIAFTREAGYDPGLRAHSPNLQLALNPVSTAQPAGWNVNLPWHADYARILDPDHPAVCMLYTDRQSAQSNATEAGYVTALATLLRMQLNNRLLYEIDATGQQIVNAAPALFTGDEFWERGIGIVVPHRAQMSLVAARLIATFPGDSAERIRSAVDTVERFQGQQRDVIIGAFGIGDPDLILAEEEFLFSLRRFNVMASRARAKLVILVSKTLVEHLSDDADVLEESLLLKRYAEFFCQPAPAGVAVAPWELRWR
jgi:hypothetical protein